MSEALTKSETAKARKKDWLTLLAGVRLSSFHGDVSEDVADPLFGATVTVPRLGWVLRGPTDVTIRHRLGQHLGTTPFVRKGTQRRVLNLAARTTSCDQSTTA